MRKRGGRNKRILSELWGKDWKRSYSEEENTDIEKNLYRDSTFSNHGACQCGCLSECDQKGRDTY